MNSIFQDETPSSRRLNREDYETLRGNFDGEDSNMYRGMSIVAPRRLQVRYRPEKDNPQAQFLYNNAGTQSFLLHNFPLLEADKDQKTQAGRWAAVISLYFRQGLSDSCIE